jgi:hypothetical protein
MPEALDDMMKKIEKLEAENAEKDQKIAALETALAEFREKISLESPERSRPSSQ